MPHEQLLQEMAQHDLFLLPTLGENFGHAIVEALHAGCPVLISDKTPWRNLESKCAGWELPAEEAGCFRDVVQRCIDMDEQEHRRWRDGAQRLAESVVHDDAAIDKNQELFAQAVRCVPPSGRKRERKASASLTQERRNHFDGMADLWETKYEPGGPLRAANDSPGPVPARIRKGFRASAGFWVRIRGYRHRLQESRLSDERNRFVAGHDCPRPATPERARNRL